jgi:hypothetical protein
MYHNMHIQRQAEEEDKRKMQQGIFIVEQGEHAPVVEHCE